MTKRMPVAVDLFCGCGGISSALRASGVRVAAGVDIEPNYMSTFRHNFPEAHSVQGDITEIEPEDFASAVGVAPGRVDLVVGGPPCQGFSKNVPRRHRRADQDNNRLVLRFLQYCEALRPTAILMENVAEMKNGFDQLYTEEIFERLEKAGYSVTHAVLNAADYGVPQRRRRAFFLAAPRGLPLHFPAPTHAPPDREEDLFGSPRHVTVWDAIGDLPSIEHGVALDPSPYARDSFSDYQRWARDSRVTVRNHVARRLQPTQYARLASLQPGQGFKDLPPALRTRGGYSGAYGRLRRDMIAPTITRWVFHPGSGRWGHPEDIRVLSIREVARIQGFRDSFEFVGTYTQQAGQLGNAVPPLLAQRILEAVRQQLAI